MRWFKTTAVIGALLAGGVAAGAAALTEGQDKDKLKDKSPAIERRERVVVAPEIQMFGGGGVRIGVELREVNADIARERKLPAVEGALVENVDEESPAAKAGIKTGDVITGLDGERVRSVRQLQRLVGDTPEGRTVKVTVMREGKKMDLSVTPEAAEGPQMFGRLGRDFEGDIRRGVEEGLRALPREFTFRSDRPGVYRFERPEGEDQRVEPLPPAERARPESRVGPMPPPGRARPDFRVEPGPPLRWFFDGTPSTGRLGVMIQDLTPQLGDFFGVKDGVLVATVNPDSAGARAGLKAGDVITTVDGKAVGNPDELTRAIREPSDGAEISIGIVRDRKAQTLKVKLPAAARKGVPL